MIYKLTFKDKLYLLFHSSDIDRINYLIPKVENHTINYYKEKQLKPPFNMYKYVWAEVQHILFDYENN